VAVAPDGSWLASGGRDRPVTADGTVRIWDVATGQVRVTLTGHKRVNPIGHASPVEAVAVAPDGSWLASGGEDGTVRIWDAATWQELDALTGHTGGVMSVAVAADGSWLASGGEDGTVRIWDVAAWQVQALMRVDGSVHVCVWLGSHALAVGGSAGLYLFGFLTEANPVTARQ
jgi:WD40 repeat protein